MEEPKPRLTRKNLKRVLRYLKPYLPLEFGLAVIMSVMITLGLVEPLVLKVLIDDVLVDRNAQLLTVIVAGLVALFILRGGLNIIVNYLYSFVGQRILFDIRYGLFRHLERLHVGFFTHTKTGEIMSRVNNDVERLQSIVTSTFVSLITDLLTLVAILVLMLYLDWQLALLALIPFPFIFVSQVYFGKKIKKQSKRTREQSADILSFFQEVISGIRLVQSFVTESFEARRLLNKSRGLIRLRIRLGVLGALTGSVAGFLAGLGPILVLLYGGRAVIRGDLTLGGLVAFYAFVIRLFGPVSRLAQHNVTIQTAMASIERIFEYLDVEPKIKTRPHSIGLEKLRGSIEFKNVHFAYDGDEPVLQDLSLRVHPGQRVALVGRSGAGKSTIINLLFRFYDPQAGAILIDNHDIRDIRLRNLRKHLGLVSQDTILFNATVSENIRYGRVKATDDEITRAAVRAHIHEFIEALPDKYETMIGAVSYTHLTLPTN